MAGSGAEATALAAPDLRRQNLATMSAALI
jgi:hypothetical protein